MSDRLQVISSIEDLHAALAPHRAAGHSIGLVPTMGNLHAGHEALVTAARTASDTVVTSIFVNPLQFGVNEDLSTYPRTFRADCEVLGANGCDFVFAPSPQEMYPDGMKEHTVIRVPEISELYCGRSRPGHFDGVCTVVAKLFNIVQPDKAWFGLKDYQQLYILRRMVRDLELPVELIGLPTVRESSGLALSSRNSYLNAEEKQNALALIHSLRAAAKALRHCGSDLRVLEDRARQQLQQAGMEPDYFSICDASTLLPATGKEHKLVILAAARIGSTRLIDNILVDLQENAG